MPNDTSPITLITDIADVSGVGPRRAELFRGMGLRCVADLIRHLPLRYEYEQAEQDIAEALATVPVTPKGHANICVRGELDAIRTVRGRGTRVEGTLVDESGTVRLTWFNAPWLRGRLHPGLPMRVWGRATRRGPYLQMVNPRWEPLDDEEPVGARPECTRPIYPATEGLSSREIEKAIRAILEPALKVLDDHLHEAYRERTAMPTLAEAYRMVHAPDDADEAARGRRRIAFDELLLLELGVMLKREHRRRTLHALALRHDAELDRHIVARFPFALTESQRSVIEVIARDLTETMPMNRLLQGDVGSGKTVVALYAMLMAVASGHQAALLAPTELLADQHHASISRMLEGADVSIELLTGGLRAARRREVLEGLASGAVNLVVGTHALLTADVAFDSLALAVIDEQHRFGVHQRATVRAKRTDPGSCPHVLVMTATPIPRTLSLTIFGDLDVSTITSLPPGRRPIITKHVTQDKRLEVYDYLDERLAAGDQAYVVVPVIDESSLGLADVESHLAWLNEGPLKGRRLSAMHGRVPREERETIMRRFRDGEIDALVATTVIEVGVDVPKANVMVIEHADRFGLAQLHQLRGRVGRSAEQGLCVLFAEPITDDGRARIDAITSSNDGFAIAEKDLEIRGPGELFGAKQAGLAPFLAVEFPRDLELLRMARRDAEEWIDENPTLAGERDALLRRRLLKAHGAALGLGDVA